MVAIVKKAVSKAPEPLPVVEVATGAPQRYSPHNDPIYRLYDKKGNAIDVLHSIDAREMLATGNYTQDAPK